MLLCLFVNGCLLFKTRKLSYVQKKLKEKIKLLLRTFYTKKNFNFETFLINIVLQGFKKLIKLLT